MNRINKFIHKYLTDDEQKALCIEALTVCNKYPSCSQEEWVAAILLYLLESYLRICTTIEEFSHDKDEGDTRGFVLAHLKQPLLPVPLMDVVARAMRKLTIDDSLQLVAAAEETAHFRRRDTSLRGVYLLVDTLTGLVAITGKKKSQVPEKRLEAPCHCESQEIFRKDLGASQISLIKEFESTHGAKGVHFVTLGTQAVFQSNDPVSHPEATVFSEGSSQYGLFSPYCAGRGCWRLTVHFSVFNNTRTTCVVYDIHARVYNRLRDAKVLATVSHSMTVELLADNSILGEHAPVNLDPGDALNVTLALEASLFESLKTTVVFGLLVDYYSVYSGSPVKQTLPSETLYVFQHAQQMGSKCHFVSRTIEQIQQRMLSEPNSIETQETCRSLLKCFEQHNGQARDE